MRDLFKKFTNFVKNQDALNVKPFEIITPPKKPKLIELKPINYSKENENELKDKLNNFFETLIYKPLNDVLNEYNAFLNQISNSEASLIRAIQEGKITFENTGFKSNFKGNKFPARISNTLSKLGAVYNKKSKIFQISIFNLPRDIQEAIEKSVIDNVFLTNSLNQALNKASDPINFETKFNQAQFEKSYQDLMNDVLSQLKQNANPKELKDITIPFELNEEQQKQIAINYTNNLKLNVKDFTDKQIIELRQLVEENTRAGYRPEVLAKKIQERFEVAKNKADFLASQETRLLTSQYTMLKYTEGGIVNRFKWGRSFSKIPDKYHETLYDKIYSFDDLPIINEETQERGLPGQRYNCKCRIIPVIEELL